MWNPFRSKQADVLSHWYALVPDFKASTQEFYSDIEKEVQTRQVPGLAITRVDFSEGGLLSAKREYLRMTRERLVFDVCASPFGTSFFFSMRFAELPSVVKLWQLLLFFFLLVVSTMFFWNLFGFWTGSFAMLVLLGCGIWMARNAVAMGMQDLDAALLGVPVFGAIYDRFLRKETYYRIDTRLMFLESIDTIVKMKVDEVTGKNGVNLVSIKQHAPIFDEFYKSAPLRSQPVSPVNDEPAR